MQFVGAELSDEPSFNCRQLQFGAAKDSTAKRTSQGEENLVDDAIQERT